MNLQNIVPSIYLEGWLHIHHVMREYSLEGGARIQGSNYIGRVQVYRLEIALENRTEDGLIISQRRDRRAGRSLIFTKE